MQLLLEISESLIYAVICCISNKLSVKLVSKYQKRKTVIGAGVLYHQYLIILILVKSQYCCKVV